MILPPPCVPLLSTDGQTDTHTGESRGDKADLSATPALTDTPWRGGGPVLPPPSLVSSSGPVPRVNPPALRKAAHLCRSHPRSPRQLQKR